MFLPCPPQSYLKTRDLACLVSNLSNLISSFIPVPSALDLLPKAQRVLHSHAGLLLLLKMQMLVHFVAVGCACLPDDSSYVFSKTMAQMICE